MEKGKRTIEDLKAFCIPIEDLGDGKIKCLAGLGFEEDDVYKSNVEIVLDISGRNKKSPPT